MFGVGSEGGALARTFSERMRQYGKRIPRQRQQPLQRREVADAWRQLFEAHPKLGLAPSIIKHRAS